MSSGAPLYIEPAAFTTVANIHAWFTDCAARHPWFRHGPGNKRLYLLEWDEILALAAPMAMLDWSIVLMVRSEQPRDNGGDYASTLSVISFTVLKHVSRNAAISQKKATWDEARTIAMGIVGKMKADERDHCQPDLPPDVIPPRLVDLSTLQMVQVEPPYADHAVGIRTLITWRTDKPEPLPSVQPALRRCIFYMDHTPHFEFRYGPDTLGSAITAFNVDGVDHVSTEVLTEGEDNYIIVGSADYHTNIIDALNALDVPDFQFDPYEALPANGGHGQYMAITYPVALNWRIEFRIGHQYYRYTSAGLMTRTYGPGDPVPDWEEPYNYDGTEALPTLCEDLPTLPPAYVYPDPALRRCAFYQDITPHFRIDIASTIRVLHFTSNGVDHTYAENFLAETDNYITVGGEDWFANLVDLLNRMNVPFFAFAPTERYGTPGYPNTHGGFMTITYPIGYSWYIEVQIGYLTYRYTTAGLETWNGTAWEPIFNYIGYEQDPHDCQDL